MANENIADLELAYYIANIEGFAGGVADGRRLYYLSLLELPDETGTAADLQKQYLESLGYRGAVQDMQEQYLIDEGYVGDLAAMQIEFYRTPPIGPFGDQVYQYPLSSETDPTYTSWSKPAGYTYYPGEGIGADAPITNMANMFLNKGAFNDPLISTWDVSAVTSMSGMFNNADGFNQSLSSWNTSLVTNMSYMFNKNAGFKNGGAALTFDTSSVTNMSYMFKEATSFNQDISSFNTSSVTNMEGMIQQAYAFNQDISSWDTGGVTNMVGMFFLASAFNVDLTPWNVTLIPSKPTSFDTSASSWALSRPIWGSNAGVFPYSARAYQYPLSSATDPTNGYAPHRNTAGYTYYPGEGIGTDSPIIELTYMFENTAINDPLISTWDVSSVVDAQWAFLNCDSFNQDLSAWDLSSCTNFTRMFLSSLLWNNGGVPLTWTLGSAITMENMFNNCPAFNVDVASWDTSTVTNMVNMFRSASSFNQDLSRWNVIKIPSEPSNFKTGANAWVLPKPIWGTTGTIVVNDLSAYTVETVSTIEPLGDNNKSPIYVNNAETFLYCSPGTTDVNSINYCTMSVAGDVTTLSAPVTTVMPWAATATPNYSMIHVSDDGLKAMFAMHSGADPYNHDVRSGTMSVAHDLSTWVQDGLEFGPGVYNPFNHIVTPWYAVTNDDRGMRLYMFHAQQFSSTVYVNTLKLYSFGTPFDLTTLTLISDVVTTPEWPTYGGSFIFPQFDVAANGNEIYIGNRSGGVDWPTFTVNRVEVYDADDLSTMTRDPADYSVAPMTGIIIANPTNMDTVGTNNGGAFYYSKALVGYVYRAAGA